MTSMRFAGHAFAAVLACLVVLVSAPLAHAAGVPSDQYAQGYVGLCNKQGQNITSGSVYDKPFVWRAVSSVAAPVPFNGSGRKAILYAYQPRPGVDASEWSGDEMTTTTHYTNRAVPMAQANRRDFALSDFLNEYPPEVNGIVELRIYYSSVDVGFSTNYAASFIQVHGTSWTLVKGGNVNCKAGKAFSSEAKIPRWNKAGLQPPQLLSPLAAKSVGAPLSRAANVAARSAALASPAVDTSSSPGASPQASASASDSGSSGGSSAAPSDSSNQAADVSSGGSNAGAVAAVSIAVLLAAGGGLLWWRRAHAPKT